MPDAMYKIELTSNSIRTMTDDPSNGTYVFYTGGIAGISDSSVSQADAKALDRGADEVQLDRH